MAAQYKVVSLSQDITAPKNHDFNFLKIKLLENNMDIIDDSEDEMSTQVLPLLMLKILKLVASQTCDESLINYRNEIKALISYIHYNPHKTICLKYLKTLPKFQDFDKVFFGRDPNVRFKKSAIVSWAISYGYVNKHLLYFYTSYCQFLDIFQPININKDNIYQNDNIGNYTNLYKIAEFSTSNTSLSKLVHRFCNPQNFKWMMECGYWYREPLEFFIRYYNYNDLYRDFKINERNRSYIEKNHTKIPKNRASVNLPYILTLKNLKDLQDILISRAFKK